MLALANDRGPLCEPVLPREPHAHHAGPSSVRPSSSVAISRMRYFCTFPVTVIGKESKKRT